jgi:2-oxoglutarate ferredoxin oxidoreductase subunit alpha
MSSRCYYEYIGKDYDAHIAERFGAMEKEAMYESYMVDDAEIILVSYGVISRVVKEAVILARERGEKLGLIRPITLWPFPKEAFKNKTVSAFISIEMCVLPQMAEDSALAARGIAPVFAMNTGGFIPDEEEIFCFIEEVRAGRKTKV